MIYLICAMLLTGLLLGCNNQSIKESAKPKEKSSYNHITSIEAQERLKSEKGIIVLDVRTKEEYETGHISGSILIDVNNLQKEAEITLTDKESPIFVYCRSGKRSITAANILVKLGYKSVYDLGGINDWPYEVVK